LAHVDASCAADAVEYDPGGQGAHAAAPAAEAYVPALQFAQAVPEKEAAEPAGHCWHAVAPALEETFPDAHAMQPVEEEASVPEGHRAQLLLPLAPE